MFLRVCFLLVLWGGCSCTSSLPQQTVAVAFPQRAIQGFLWQGDWDSALDLLDAHNWESTGSVALERIRQDLRLNLNQRTEVLLELQSWQRRYPNSADLQYLQARLLEDPIGRWKELNSLHRRYPQHPWIRIGQAATAQLLRRWSVAAQLLRSDTPDGESAPFFRIVWARQLLHDSKIEEALALLAEDAFEQHFERSLLEYLRISSSGRNPAEARRARSELDLRRAEQLQLDTGGRIDLAFQRLLGEWHRCKEQPLREILELLDGWCQIAGAPSGWGEVGAYQLTGVVEMVRPETHLGGVSQAWAQAGRYLLAGSALGRGKEFHLLRDVVVMQVDWPRHELPIEIVAARSVLTPQANTAQGGAVFRGFYLRLDSSERGAARLQQSLDDVGAVSLHVPPLTESRSPAPLPILGRLESHQLPIRLRQQVIEQSLCSVQDLELLHLSLHEAGHLEEVLRWLDFGFPFAQVAASFVTSQFEFGNPILWLEYRAQLRVLASGWQPQWALAEIIERGQNPRDPYFAPYRKILRDLVQVSEEFGWPPLALWSQQSPASLVALAQELIRQRGFNPSPDLGNDRVVEALINFNLLENSPGNRVLPTQLD